MHNLLNARLFAFQVIFAISTFVASLAAAIQPGTICVGQIAADYDHVFYGVFCNKPIVDRYIGFGPLQYTLWKDSRIEYHDNINHFFSRSDAWDRATALRSVPEYGLHLVKAVRSASGDNFDIFTGPDVQFDFDKNFICLDFILGSMPQSHHFTCESDPAIDCKQSEAPKSGEDINVQTYGYKTMIKLIHANQIRILYVKPRSATGQ